MKTGLGREAEAAMWPLVRGTEGIPDREGLSGWGEASGDIIIESTKGYTEQEAEGDERSNNRKTKQVVQTLRAAASANSS